MKILLLGDYSNVHCTLAKGLKALGHECVVASDGDHWKDYPRDVDLKRELDLKGTISFMWRLMKAMHSLKGYDIVQLINPIFIELKAEKIEPFYRYLRKHNKKVVMGAFGMDYYWCKVNRDERPLRYSDFNFGNEARTDIEAVRFCDDWIGTPKETLNKLVANDCDWIVSGLYEYWVTYQEFKEKMSFIPFPIEMPSLSEKACEQGVDKEANSTGNRKLRIFAGISKDRSAYKGTDIMLAAAKAVQEKHPDKLELKIAEGVPFAQYKNMMDSSDAILDQLYSYTPAMNSLLAMSKGVINIGGGEPENYEILGEKELKPIVNVLPTFESCFEEIEQMVLHPERIEEMKQQSIEYVRRHHDHIKVAKQYESLYKQLLK